MYIVPITFVILYAAYMHIFQLMNMAKFYRKQKSATPLQRAIQTIVFLYQILFLLQSLWVMHTLHTSAEHHKDVVLRKHLTTEFVIQTLTKTIIILTIIVFTDILTPLSTRENRLQYTNPIFVYSYAVARLIPLFWVYFSTRNTALVGPALMEIIISSESATFCFVFYGIYLKTRRITKKLDFMSERYLIESILQNLGNTAFGFFQTVLADAAYRWLALTVILYPKTIYLSVIQDFSSVFYMSYMMSFLASINAIMFIDVDPYSLYKRVSSTDIRKAKTSFFIFK